MNTQSTPVTGTANVIVMPVILGKIDLQAINDREAKAKAKVIQFKQEARYKALTEQEKKANLQHDLVDTFYRKPGVLVKSTKKGVVIKLN